MNYYVVTPLAAGSGHEKGFTYSHIEVLAPGQLVMVHLGRRMSLGVVTDMVEQPSFATRDIEKILELDPMPEYLPKLVEWLSDYYACSQATTWSTVLPAGIQRKSRLKPSRSKKTTLVGLPPATPDQQAVLKAIRSDHRRTHLLQGVTGSGKTRIYLDLATETIASGQSVIVLVPEIMLTPQIVDVFTKHFGQKVVTTHSSLTAAKRRDIWLAALHSKEPMVVIGPRSSLFLPVPNLGLVVIDECHETSYKQEQAPRYMANAAAAKLAELTGSKLILGSATPGLNEVYLAQEGKIAYHRLRHRAGGQPQPIASTVDLRNKELLRTSRYLSQPLLDAVTETLATKRQSLLFINRRGSASSQICGACGEVTMCPHCQMPFTFHADLMRLVCHHCNRRIAPPAVCPFCNASELRYLGGGTKRIEEEVKRLYPKARVARIDRDSATLAHMTDTYKGLQDGTVDILIGTQMIAKGLDLPMIDTIGVVSADTMLHLPDYSAAERTFGLLLQVAGRAGRGDQPGRVIIQSYTPDHPAIRFAASGDFDAFAAAELTERQTLRYPPYRYLLKLTVGASTRETCQRKSAELVEKLKQTPDVVLLGPAPALLETIGGKFHWVVAVKSARRNRLVEIAHNVPSGWTADLDPLNLL